MISPKNGLCNMNGAEEKVVLVDEMDSETGIASKLEAHQLGLLHRAFSVFVFNSAGQMMLQKRAWDKYHSRGLWSNTCCSHPRPGEEVRAAAHRRLMEEMGFDCQLNFSFLLHYNADLDTGLVEHELDHIFVGQFEGQPQINSQEVADWKWVTEAEIQEEFATHPEQFTPWFRLVADKVFLLRKKENFVV
jgi:isopentenyl-diphosphate Delta-isomerase